MSDVPTTRAAFITQFAASRQRIDELIDSLDAESMVVPVDAGGWNVRDHLAHLCAWESTRIALLRKLYPWDAFGITREEFEAHTVDSLNAALREMTKQISPNEVVSMLRETHDVLLGELAAVSDADLEGAWIEFWISKSNAAPTLIGILWYGTVHHFDQHHGYITAIT